MFICLSLFLPYCFGLGCCVWTVLTGAIPVLEGRRQPDGRDTAALLLAGLLANALLVLWMQQLAAALGIGSILAVLGGFGFLGRNPHPYRHLLRTNASTAAIVGWVVLLFLPAIFLEPIAAWDARSIWFFHGKIIAHDGALAATGGWAGPEIRFSRVMYPKFAPILIGQFAWIAGFWNEHFPKAALLAFLAPGLIAIDAAFASRRVAWLLAMAALIFAPGTRIWDGYLDGYLALYAALAAFHAGRWMDGHEPRDALAAGLCLGVVLNLKTEGILVALALATAFAIARVAYPADIPTLGLRPSARPILGGFVLASAGPLTWHLLRHRWHIPGGPGVSPFRWLARLEDGSTVPIVKALLVDNGTLRLAAAVLLSGWITRALLGTTPWRFRLPVLTAILHGTLLTCIYLATTSDLAWHLRTSADRVILPVLACLGVAVAAAASSLEAPDPPKTAPARRA